MAERGCAEVIPTGTVSKWTSKKRVPMAGYLCTQEGGTVPVLHTLPTPCVLTTLSDDGRVLPPSNASAEVPPRLCHRGRWGRRG